MGPLRILILAALLYIGYRLISANFKKDSGDEKKDEGEKRSGGRTGAITDVLVEDPVCQKLVPKEQAYTVELEGEQRFFCSKECGDKFVADQENSD